MKRGRYVLAAVLLGALFAGVFWLGRVTAGVPASQVEAAREFWLSVLIALGAAAAFLLILLYVVLTWKR